MRKAWIENGVIRDIAPDGDPFEFYHHDIAEHYSADVPDNAENGDGWDGVTLTKPLPPVPSDPPPFVPPKRSPVEFKLCFTSAERVAIKAARASDPILEDTFSILDDPRLTEVDLALLSVQTLIDYCVSKELLTPERAAQIKRGEIL